MLNTFVVPVRAPRIGSVMVIGLDGYSEHDVLVWRKTGHFERNFKFASSLDINNYISKYCITYPDLVLIHQLI